MKLTQKRSGFFKRTFDILINIIFLFILFALIFKFYNVILSFIHKIPNLNNYIGNLITVSVTIILAIISYATKIKVYLLKLLYIFKQKIYILFTFHYHWICSAIVKNYNVDKLYGTTEQINVINSAIDILKNSKQNIFLISSFPGKGKTTTLMLLLDVIAHDKELYCLFNELQYHIIFFDSMKDYEQLLYCLNHPEKQSDRIFIIDNMQKYTILFINEIMNKIKNLMTYSLEDKRKALFILMFQKTESNIATYEYIKHTFFNDNFNNFNLNQNNAQKKNRCESKIFVQSFNDNIDNIKEDELMKNHLEKVASNCKNKKIILFFDKLVFHPDNQDYSTKEEMMIYVLASIIFICSYYGYINKKILRLLWTKKYKFHLKQILITNKFVSNKILVPFPFVHAAYIFNENLARQYKKMLSTNIFFINTSYSISEHMFLNCDENYKNMKWLFFISCSPKFCLEYSQNERINIFEKTLNNFHLQYILDLVENEVFILPEKKEIFRQELGILYIWNGEWKKAKKTLYPYIINTDINKDIWKMQLKIIEAEHGCCDEDNLEMLDCMKKECTDPIILFQISYWYEHILMEHGKFSLYAWKKLLEELKTSDQLLQLFNDEHFALRLVSDLERTYYLSGNIQYSEYKYILKQYSNFNKNANSVELLLSKAYYIQYDILTQLGIWGFIEYPNIDPNIIDKPTLTDCNNIIEDLVTQAINIYDICIDKYQSSGKKKYRTLQVRRAELSLCLDMNQYINVLNKYNEFELYAIQNNISVFEGYSQTQKGKAFALYATSEFQKGNIDKSSEFLTKAEIHLMNAKKTYEKFGNVYGELRAVFLTILVNMIQDRNHMRKQAFSKKYENALTEILNSYEIEEYYVREYNIIQYIKKNIFKISLPINIIRYYPIILQ